MVSVDKLLKSYSSRKIGNHRKEVERSVDIYYFFDTAIITVDRCRKTITKNNGGYNTSSTNRAINSYMKHPIILNLIENNGYSIRDKSL